MVQAFHANIIYPNKQEQVSYVSWIIFYVNLRLFINCKKTTLNLRLSKWTPTIDKQLPWTDTSYSWTLSHGPSLHFQPPIKGQLPLMLYCQSFKNIIILYILIEPILHEVGFLKLPTISNSNRIPFRYIFLVTYYWLWTKWHIELFFVSLKEFEMVVFNSV